MKLKLNYKKITSTLLLSLLLLSATPTLASTLKESIENNYITTEVTARQQIAEVKDPVDIISDIIKIALSFLGIIFVILIIVSGYQWLMSGGNSDAIGKARDRMIHATIGLIIVLGVFAISQFILKAAIDATK